MVIIISILFVFGCLLLIVLALGICRASSQADDMLGRLFPQHLPDTLDGERR